MEELCLSRGGSDGGGEGKRVPAEGRQWREPACLRNGGGTADHAAQRQWRGGQRDQQGFGRLARTAVRGRDTIGVGGGERHLHRFGGGGAAEVQRARRAAG